MNGVLFCCRSLGHAVLEHAAVRARACGCAGSVWVLGPRGGGPAQAVPHRSPCCMPSRTDDVLVIREFLVTHERAFSTEIPLGFLGSLPVQQSASYRVFVDVPLTVSRLFLCSELRTATDAQVDSVLARFLENSMPANNSSSNSDGGTGWT